MVLLLPRSVTLGLGSALALLLVNAAVSYRNTQALFDNEQQVNETYRVLSQLEQTLSTLKDAETGGRGYVITGKENYLEPYRDAVTRINQQLEGLRQLTSDDPLQQQRLQALEQEVETKLDYLQTQIEIRRNQGLEAAIQFTNQTERGRELMDQVRQQVAVMQAEENQRLQQRQQQSARMLSLVLATFAVVNGLGVLLIGVIYYLLRRDAWRRQREAKQSEGLFRQLEAERNQLRESEQRLHRVILEAPLPLILHTEGGEVVQINRMWTELSGYTQADMPTVDDWINLAYRREQRPVQASIRAKINTLYQVDQRVEEGEIAIITARGEQRIWEFFSAPIGNLPDGRRLVITAALDITDRKQAEAALRELNTTLEQRVADRTAELQDANDALKAFTYSVSHDLRAPLRTLQGFTQALQEDCADQIDELGQSYIDYIMEGAQQMDTLISDLLAYSRLSRVEINLYPVDLDAALSEVLQQLSQSIQAHHAQIHIHSPLPPVQAHRTTLIQVLTNLLSNALKFVPADVTPKIEIWAEALANQEREETGDRRQNESNQRSGVRLPRASADGSQASQSVSRREPGFPERQPTGARSQASPPPSFGEAHEPPSSSFGEAHGSPSPLVRRGSRAASPPPPTLIRLWVKDNGIGIAPEHQERIFRVFERLHGVESYPGTGIGLAIVRKGLERMGGQAGVESQLGEGSRFWIALPGAVLSSNGVGDD
ncbi:PAS domain S-box protein [Leptolyngbya sp. NK1-12]|uniref:histidine kinase n=1 Tax=Leptolyngbya sp. NK1-12 TaxID=2547451 RepID=A0AA96WMG8_9CYAN|nr:PAS domain S-box protein [Leptolyngbya sp. NK1-12]